MDSANSNSRFFEFNLDPALAEMASTAPAGQTVEGILRLEDPLEIPPPFRVVSQFNRICTGRFAAADVWTIRRHPNVLSFKAARPLGVSSDREDSAEWEISQEIEIPRRAAPPFGGSGCIVAALDFGLDFAHPNFVNPDGTTRLLSLWDQSATYDPAYPNPYGYGRVYSREAVNAALLAPDPYQALHYHPAISDTGKGSHGTHTMDIAAGNGRVGVPGGGYNAHLMFVHLSTPRLGVVGDLGDSVRLLEGLDYVEKTAAGRPWVVNLSVGRMAGCHDGTSPVEQGMHELLRKGPCRAICQSAGNYRSADLAVHGWLHDGEHRDLKWIIDPRDTTDNEIDIWYSGKDRFVIAIRPPQGSAFMEVRLGEVKDVVYDGAVVGRVYNRKDDPNNKDHNGEVFLFPGAPPGVWTVRLIADYVISGRFHAWIERSLPRPGAQSRFDPTITSHLYTLGTIATSPLVITVGAYDPNVPGTPMAPFSSCGPTRDERRDKPELLAPGVDVVAARSIPRGATRQEGLLAPRSGTSMSSPHVAGAVAAMFEAAGRPVSIEEIRDCLRRSAEAFSGDDEWKCWGRLDTARAIREIQNLQEPEGHEGEAFVDERVVMPFPIETSSPLQLIDELSDDISTMPSSPADLYRRVLYNERWTKRVQHLLEVVALPSREPKDAVRAGDWIVRANPGVEDVGHIAVLASGDLDRVLDSRGRAAPNTMVLRPSYSDWREAGEDTGQFGTGTRNRVTSTLDIPFLWVCNIRAIKRITTAGGSERKTGMAPSGTGVLISPRHVLTAAHVLKSVTRENGTITEREETEAVSVDPARDGSSKPLGTIDASSWKLHPKWNPERENPATDYALITLEKPVGDATFKNLGGQPLCFWGSNKCGGGTVFDTLPAAITDKLIGSKIFTAGYPESKKEEMWCFTGKGTSGSKELDKHLTESNQTTQWFQKSGLFHVTADAEHGQSGSPIWVENDGKRFLAGILVDAGKESNTAVAITDDLVRQLRQWMGQGTAAHESHEFEDGQPGADVFEDENPEFLLEWETLKQLPPRMSFEADGAAAAEDVPPLPRGLPQFQFFFQPMKPNAAGTAWQPDGAEKPIEPMNPGFLNSDDDLVTGPLQEPLVKLLTETDDFKKYLTSESIRTRTARADDKIHVALVDLTGRKLTKPEFAGWGSTVAVDVASSAKVPLLFAAFQLLNDLKHIAAAENIKKIPDLITEMNTRWKAVPKSDRPQLTTFLGSAAPPDLTFSDAIQTAVDNIINNKHDDPNNANHSASVLLNSVGFPYVDSLMWQSGLRHPKRGGLWVEWSFEPGGPVWNDPIRPSPGSFFGHTGTALSFATFFTLLAQGRLVNTHSSAEMKRKLSTASFFQKSYWDATPIPDAAIASKVGLLLKCVEWGTEVDENGKRKCKRSISTHAHEPALIENGRLRYVVALMTVGIDHGVREVLQRLIGPLNDLIRSQNP